jgi:hypothetical protein
MGTNVSDAWSVASGVERGAWRAWSVDAWRCVTLHAWSVERGAFGRSGVRALRVALRRALRVERDASGVALRVERCVGRGAWSVASVERGAWSVERGAKPLARELHPNAASRGN